MIAVEYEVDALADKLAERVTQKLGGSMVSSVLPDWFAKTLQHAAHGQQWRHDFVVPMGMGNGFRFQVLVDPAGTLYVELMDINGSVAWRGTFRADDFGRQA